MDPEETGPPAGFHLGFRRVFLPTEAPRHLGRILKDKRSSHQDCSRSLERFDAHGASLGILQGIQRIFVEGVPRKIW